jgi:hypothetical protein
MVYTGGKQAAETLGPPTITERAAAQVRQREQEQWWATYGLLYVALGLGAAYLVTQGPKLMAQAKQRQR